MLQQSKNEVLAYSAMLSSRLESLYSNRKEPPAQPELGSPLSAVLLWRHRHHLVHVHMLCQV